MLGVARFTRAFALLPGTSWFLRLVSVLLSVSLTLSLAAFIAGGSASDLGPNADIGRNDTVSVGDESPRTWFRRGSSRVDHRAIGLDFEFSVDDDFESIVVVLEPIDEPPTLASFVAYASEHGQANPARGPPGSNDCV